MLLSQGDLSISPLSETFLHQIIPRDLEFTLL